MTDGDAARLIAAAGWTGSAPERWADLGCGDGTFTRALASLLPSGSTIDAMDLDRTALGAVPESAGEVTITTHVGDFTVMPWPFPAPDGILMANALHYVRDQAAFLRPMAATMPRPRLIVVEYDSDEPSAWVPYPISRQTLTRLGRDAGLHSVTLLGTRRSRYRRAPLYAAQLA